MTKNNWIGVDLDGTLAYYDSSEHIGDIGDPIPLMMRRVKIILDLGIKVKIFTARACNPSLIPEVKKWLEKHGLGHLEVTNEKDFDMIFLYDDRCIQVEYNTGKLIRRKPDKRSA